MRNKQKCKYWSLLAIAGFAAALLCGPSSTLAQVLGTASNFAVLGATPNVTNTGATVVTGNVGVWPAEEITGFPPGTIVPGTGFLHKGDAVAQQAQTDNTTAFGVLTSLTPTGSIGPELGGILLLPPGVYTPTSGDFALTAGILQLNGPGLYVFQTNAALTTAAGGSIDLNGASPCDVWWTVPSSATIGTGTAMQGNILALTSITIGTGASLQGRALAQTGTVTLATNAVTACSGGTATSPAPGFLVPAPVAIPVRIPTLSEWAQLGMVLILVGVAVWRLRRRRAPVSA